MCHNLFSETDMQSHDCRHEYVYAHGLGFKVSQIHDQTVKALMARHNVRRNSPCFCHSGKKFKKCCGRPRTAAQLQEMIDERLEKLSRRGVDVDSQVIV